MGDPVTPWTCRLRLADLAQGPKQAALRPDDAQRAAIAAQLRLEGLPRLTADLVVSPWLDGAEIRGEFQAVVTQICGVSLEAFDEAVTGELEVRLVHRDSPGAPGDEFGDLALDIDAPDPPELLEGDEIDLAAYVVEHLALAIDPYPRKPGAQFDYVAETPSDSPFAALRDLKRAND